MGTFWFPLYFFILYAVAAFVSKWPKFEVLIPALYMLLPLATIAAMILFESFYAFVIQFLCVLPALFSPALWFAFRKSKHWYAAFLLILVSLLQIASILLAVGALEAMKYTKIPFEIVFASLPLPETRRHLFIFPILPAALSIWLIWRKRRVAWT